MTLFGKIFFPLLILGTALGVTKWMIDSRPEPKTREIPRMASLVEVTVARKGPEQLTVTTQGTVVPRTKTSLIPEVSGLITHVSDSLFVGGFFEKGETLLRIDPIDYEAALVRAQAQLAQTELILAQEKARSLQARKDWEDLGKGAANELTLRIPQLREAEANVASARSQVETAQRNLDRTTIIAPYAGMVTEKTADRGQYVTPGTRLATIFAIDFAEVRLPLSNAELAYLDLPYAYRGESGREMPGPRVALSATIGGQEFSWDARIVRTEGAIDARSRMIYAVAKIDDPYGRDDANEQRPPLKIGQFVRAEIEGITAPDVAKLPRHALKGRDRVLVVDDKSEIRHREIEVIRADEKFVYVGKGIEDGERICLTVLDFVVEGMKVQVKGEASADSDRAGMPPGNQSASQ